MAETWLGEYFSPEASTQASPLSALTILKGTRFLSLATTPSSKRRPIRRLTANRVPSGLVTAWRLAGWPTRRSPSLEKATIEGVVRAPSAFSITLGVVPSITATQLLVVPRSILITFAITCLFPSEPGWNPRFGGFLALWEGRAPVRWICPSPGLSRYIGGAFGPCKRAREVKSPQFLL